MMLYLSGPITGIPLYNRPAFEDAAVRLRAQGHVVLNPLDIEHYNEPTWEIALRIDLIAMLQPACNAIALLPDWQLSRGARLERHVAQALSFKVFYYVGGKLVE